MILSLVYRTTCRLLGALAVAVRHDASKDAELPVLRHENTVPRRRAEPVRYTRADRPWFSGLSSLITRRRRCLPGHPGHAAGLASQARRAALGLQRSTWPWSAAHRDHDPATDHHNGHGQSKLGAPAHPRRASPTRAPHRSVHRLADPARCRPGPHPATNRTLLANLVAYPGTAHRRSGLRPPSRPVWTTQAARNALMNLNGRPEPIKYLIRDRDSRFTTQFDRASRSYAARYEHHGRTRSANT
jgi:hypothetical protein